MRPGVDMVEAPCAGLVVWYEFCIVNVYCVNQHPYFVHRRVKPGDTVTANDILGEIIDIEDLEVS